jgi:hypothetical protein
MTEQPWWKKVLMSGAVWTAFLAWANGVVLIVWPNVPTNLLSLTNVLIGTILAAIGIGNVAVQAYKVRKLAAMRKWIDEVHGKNL